MSRRPHLDTGSLRAQRLRALAPRIALYTTLAILSIGGLRGMLAGEETPIVRAAPAAGAQIDVGMESFAEGFARVYLSWDATRLDQREQALAPFLGDSGDPDGGLRPGEGTSQSVRWTAVAAVERDRYRTLVTVVAQTDRRLVHLAVPVTRDAQGVMRVAGYPALVGPPAIDRESGLEAGDEQEVEDPELAAVAERALDNYLARSQRDLLADLTPDAIVSLPDQALQTSSVDAVTWVVPGRRVAVELIASDRGGTELTLRYELDVRLSDRWYVRAIHVDPTGGDIR